MLKARRRRRAMERRLRELDQLDATYVLGAMPPTTPAPSREVPTALTGLLSLAGLAALLLFTPLGPVELRSAVGLGPHRLETASPRGIDDSYRFARLQPRSNDPVTWDPCRPIHYRINPAGGPHDAVSLAQAAVARASAVTGLRFQYDGTTTDRPSGDGTSVPKFAEDRPPVLIAWATGDEVRRLDGDIAGLGGATARERKGRLEYVTGAVTLDADAFAEIGARHGGEAEQRAIVLHELGHLVGLAHVHDPRELMNSDNVGVLDYAAGDRTGLALLGRGKCT